MTEAITSAAEVSQTIEAPPSLMRVLHVLQQVVGEIKTSLKNNQGVGEILERFQNLMELFRSRLQGVNSTLRSWGECALREIDVGVTRLGFRATMRQLTQLDQTTSAIIDRATSAESTQRSFAVGTSERLRTAFNRTVEGIKTFGMELLSPEHRDQIEVVRGNLRRIFALEEQAGAFRDFKTNTTVTTSHSYLTPLTA